jgi:hypothetical protein
MLGKIALAVLTHQLGVNGKEQIDRILKYNAARRAADERGKPLLVVGGPWGESPVRKVTGIRGHPCGDT